MKTTQFSIASLNRCFYPYPVYEAHFTDGTVGRLSIWMKLGKDYDFERGKRICEQVFNKTVSHGFVEQDIPGKPWIRVPHPTAKPEIKRFNYKKLLASVMPYLDGIQTAEITEARQAVA